MGTPPAQRRLVLLRHAEAGPAPVDADRQLTDRGVREAAAAGRWLAGAGTVPDRVVVSPARRARQTWEHAAGAFDATPGPLVDERVHENTVESVLAVVRGTPEDVPTLVVVGHNPALGLLAAVLDPRRPEELRSGFPPGTAAVFELDVPFGALRPGVATLLGARLPGGPVRP